MLNVDEIKTAASSRWPEIISRLGGVPMDSLDGKHHACPRCGGKDRFRMIDAADGALWCNSCFTSGNGDGIAAVMWLTGCAFREALEKIGNEVGVTTKSTETDVVEEMAWRKGVKAETLRAFGAKSATRGKVTVCRVPMYDADMAHVGNFDLSPTSNELLKGKTEYGSKLGLFVATRPNPGDNVLVVEGVKDASALTENGFLAVGLPTCRMDASLARMFRDCHVTIVPDRDKAGIDGSDETAGRLYGVSASVKIAELPAEFKQTGGADVRDVLRQRDGLAKLQQAITHAKQWAPSGVVKTKFTMLGDAVVNYIDRLTTKQLLITTGLPGVDHALSGGVMEGEMIIIAGRPSHGKTMVALQCLEWMAKERPCLLISEEMPVLALAERAVHRLTGIEKEFWNDNQEKILNTVKPHYSARQNVAIVESCMTVDAAVEAVEEAVELYGIKVFAVDYVQRLRGKGASEYEWVSDSSARLKQVAMRHNLVFLALCQLNRGIEGRATSTPRMSDLRASGQLEQDADVILFCEYLHRTDPANYRADQYRIMISKNRNRATLASHIDCIFDAGRQTLHPGPETHGTKVETRPNYSQALADYNSEAERF